MLDRLPPEVRHLLLMLAASLLGWAGSDLVPGLQDRGGAAALLAPVVMTLVTILTPLTRQYGVGSDRSETEPLSGRHEA
jgi:hypothetical protein